MFFLILFSFQAYTQGCKKSTVYFNLNKHRSEKFFLQHIDSILERFHPDTTYLMEIHGHTDESGSESENLELAAERIGFVRNYVYSKQLKNIRILTQNFGEKSPISDKNKENRRVNIFTYPLNSDGTVTVGNPNGNRVKLPINYFNKCGYCTTEPSLKTEEEVFNKNDEGISVLIESNCEQDIECYTVEFRFKPEQFNNSSGVKVPLPLKITGCGNKIQLSKDSIVLDTNYYKQFLISFDTSRNEYVVKHDCFYPYKICLCQSRDICYYRDIISNDSILNSRSAQLFTYIKTYSDNEPIYRDSVIKFIDSVEYYCGGREHTIISLGYLNEKLLFLNKKCDQLLKVPKISKNNLLSYFNLQIQVKDYKPINYLNSKLLIKIPKKEGIDSVGFYIEALDFFIPIDKDIKGKYLTKILDFPYSFGLKKGDKIISIDYKKPKKRYSKRKKVLKVKIKKKYFPIEKKSK
ncbi:MAG: OmpA family protein [Bacteroidota bacterium]